MTLRQHTSIDTHSNDATFRAGCQTFHDSFVAAGLVQTTDTGQINLTTVLRPAAQFTVAGYEIWRFNDALAAAAPIYFKFEYGSAGSSTFGFYITTGSGSDGTGTITVTNGTVTARKYLSQGVGASSGLFVPSYFNHLSDGSGFAFSYWPAGAVSGAAAVPVLVIERFRNYDGTPNAVGWNVLAGYGTSTIGSLTSEARFYSNAVIQPTTAINYWPIPTPPSSGPNYAASTVFEGTLYPVPVFTGSWPRVGGPSQLVLVVGKNDLPSGATVQVSHYGEMHAWIAVGPGGSYGWNVDTLSKIASFLIRAD